MASDDQGSREIALGLLGVGNIGKVHLESALAMDDVDLRAAADAVVENRSYARRRGVTAVYDDYETLLRSEPLDAVVVALPPFLHADAVEVAAGQGCHAFVEKPLARSVAEAESMIHTADEAGISVGVDHTLRYLPGIEAVRNAFREGRIGHVPYAHISRVNYGPFQRPPPKESPPEWLLHPDMAGGGVLIELGVHLLDVLEWTFGDLSVRAADVDRQLATRVEDAATLVCRSDATDTRITLHCGSYQWERLSEFNVAFRLEGVAGSLDYDEFAPSNFYGNAARSGIRNVKKRLLGDRPEYFGPTYYLQAYFRALEAFIDAIQAGKEPPVDATDGRRTLELVAEAYDSPTTETVRQVPSA